MTELTPELLTPHVGSAFALPDSGVVLILASVVSGPTQPGAPREVPFTLTFTAPAGTTVPQATYAVDHPELGRFELFVVPRQPAADGLARFDADFN